jgi:hypothetical protein
MNCFLRTRELLCWKSVTAVLAAAFMLSLCGAAQATVLFDQTTYDYGGGKQVSLYCPPNWPYDEYDHRMADDFTLPSSSTVTSVSARGTYDDLMGSRHGFVVTFYSGSTPNTVVSQQTILGNLTPTGDLYTIPLTTGVSLAANTQYWISIQGQSGFSVDGFKPYFANDEGSPIDHNSGTTPTTSYVPNGSAAVSMTGSTVNGGWGRKWDGDWFNGYDWKYGTSYTYQNVDLAFSLSGSIPAYLPGDADKNGTVNGADLNIVLSNYNATGMDWDHGDFNTDNTVNGADLNVVLSNYNQSSPVAGAVPEPASLLLLAVAAIIGWRARAWRKKS